jgi:hypothetical protein
MDPKTRLIVQKDLNKNIQEILLLYREFHLSRLLNDLVAIGTWPTPENSLKAKGKAIDSKGKLKIDTVPLPELKKRLAKLLKICGDEPLKDLLD